jgi:hypothetical protein
MTIREIKMQSLLSILFLVGLILRCSTMAFGLISPGISLSNNQLADLVITGAGCAVLSVWAILVFACRGGTSLQRLSSLVGFAFVVTVPPAYCRRLTYVNPRAPEDAVAIVLYSCALLVLVAPWLRKPRALVANAATPPRCSNCGYCLNGLVERRCPECGTPFDTARTTERRC